MASTSYCNFENGCLITNPAPSIDYRAHHRRHITVLVFEPFVLKDTCNHLLLSSFVGRNKKKRKKEKRDPRKSRMLRIWRPSGVCPDLRRIASGFLHRAQYFAYGVSEAPDNRCQGGRILRIPNCSPISNFSRVSVVIFTFVSWSIRMQDGLWGLRNLHRLCVSLTASFDRNCSKVCIIITSLKINYPYLNKKREKTCSFRVKVRVLNS